MNGQMDGWMLFLMCNSGRSEKLWLAFLVQGQTNCCQNQRPFPDFRIVYFFLFFVLSISLREADAFNNNNNNNNNSNKKKKARLGPVAMDSFDSANFPACGDEGRVFVIM